MAKDICLVGGIYPPDAGGPSKFLFEFENFLLGKGKKVSVLVLTNAPSSIEESSQLNKVRVTRNSTLPSRFLHFIRQLKRLESRDRDFLVAGAFLEVLLANLTKACGNGLEIQEQPNSIFLNFNTLNYL